MRNVAPWVALLAGLVEGAGLYLDGKTRLDGRTFTEVSPGIFSMNPIAKWKKPLAKTFVVGGVVLTIVSAVLGFFGT